MKRFIFMLLIICATALPTTASVNDSTSFNPRNVKVTAKGTSGAPLGSIIAVPSFAIAKFEEESDNWYPCDGRSTTGTALASYMANVPNLNGEKRFLQGTNEVSGTVEAGLPNITGSHMIDDDQSQAKWGGAYADGCFHSWWYRGGFDAISRHEGTGASLVFDASRSNAIYGRSGTVQPASYTVRYYIRVNE